MSVGVGVGLVFLARERALVRDAAADGGAEAEAEPEPVPSRRWRVPRRARCAWLASRASSTRSPPRAALREGFRLGGRRLRRAAGRRRRGGDARRHARRRSGARRRSRTRSAAPRTARWLSSPTGRRSSRRRRRSRSTPGGSTSGPPRAAASGSSSAGGRSSRGLSSGSAGRRTWTQARGCSRCWARCPCRRGSPATSTHARRRAAAVRPAEGRDARPRRGARAAARGDPGAVADVPAAARPAASARRSPRSAPSSSPGAALVLDALGFDPPALRPRRHRRGNGRRDDARGQGPGGRRAAAAARASAASSSAAACSRRGGTALGRPDGPMWISGAGMRLGLGTTIDVKRLSGSRRPCEPLLERRRSRVLGGPTRTSSARRRAPRGSGRARRGLERELARVLERVGRVPESASAERGASRSRARIGLPGRMALARAMLSTFRPS